MRLPFIQVADETFRNAKALAGALGTDRHIAIGMFIDLWAWAVEQGPDDRPPDGFLKCDAGMADRVIAGVMEWTGDPTKLVDALVALDYIERLPDGIRVKGLGRYADAWRNARARSEAGKKSANRRWDATRKAKSMPNECVSDAASIRQNAETETETDIQNTSYSGGEAPTEVFALQAVKSRKARTASPQEQLFDALDAGRKAELGPDALPDETWSAQKKNTRLAPLLEVERQVLFDALELYCRDSYALQRDPPCPLGLFVSQWSRWVSAATKASAV